MGDVSLGPDSRVALLAELDIPAVAADLDGNITHWSAAAARPYGRGENEMLGSSLGAVRLSPEDEAIARSIVGELLAGGRFEAAWSRLDGADGLPSWMEAHCLASRDRQGVLIRVRGTTLDITIPVSADARLREAGEFWQATLDSLAARIATATVPPTAPWGACARGGEDQVRRVYLLKAASD